MLFKSVTGQAAIRDQLIHSAKENRVSHAILFHGPPGSGKFPLALAFAQYLNCTDPGHDDSCGVCPSCRKAEKFIHPDLHFVFPVVKGIRPDTDISGSDTGSNGTGTKKSGNQDTVSDHHIGKWREYLEANPYPDFQGWLSFMSAENKQAGIFTGEAEMILRKLSFKAYESDYKIVLVWLPEKMHITAANKLLKIIEEPPDKTVFLLISQSPDEILPTILSRTQLMKVNKIPDKDLAARLKEKFPGREQQIEGITRMANGNFIEAANLLEADEQNLFYHNQFVAWMRMIYRLEINEIIEWIPSVVAIGRDKQKDFLGYCLRMIRENFHMSQAVHDIVRMDNKELAFSERFHKFITPANIEEFSLLFSNAANHISLNANPRIMLLDMSLQIFRLLKKQGR